MKNVFCGKEEMKMKNAWAWWPRVPKGSCSLYRRCWSTALFLMKHCTFFLLKKHFLWSSGLKWIWIHVFLVPYKLGFVHFSFEIFLGKFRVRLAFVTFMYLPKWWNKKLRFIMVSFIVTPFASYILQIIKIMHFTFRGLMNSVIICF